jgi:hypothetical protein
MILKTADDKSARLRVLENLLPSPRLGAAQKRRLQEDIDATRLGLQGENDAAYYIDFHFGRSDRFVVLHDLRIEDGDRSAQIDHLILDRGLQITVVETKNYSAHVKISNSGEFSVEYGQRSFGIPSPIEQNERHLSVLRAVLPRLDLPTRLGVRLVPSLRSAVLFSPKAIITRPDESVRDTSSVIKADQFRAWWNEALDDESVLSSVAGAMKLVSLATLEGLGRQLLALHRPSDPLALPAYLAPQPDRAKPSSRARHTAGEAERPVAPPHQAERVTADSAPTAQAGAQPLALSSGTAVCAECGKRLSDAVVRYCRDHDQKFQGRLYCYTHQKSATRR